MYQRCRRTLLSAIAVVAPIGVSALSDQLAARPVTIGERLGSDDARCSTPSRSGWQPTGPRRPGAQIVNSADEWAAMAAGHGWLPVTRVVGLPCVRSSCYPPRGGHLRDGESPKGISD